MSSDIVLTGKFLYGLEIKIVSLTTQLLLTLAVVKEGSFTYIYILDLPEKVTFSHLKEFTL